MKKLNKVLFTIIAGLFVAGVASASLGEYWSTVSHIIPRTDSTVDIGSTAKKVRAVWADAFYGDYWISGTGNSMAIQPTGDTDDFFSFKTPADRPTIKREGGKYIYIESSNVNDVGLSFRKDADHSGTVNYYKDENLFGLTSKDPLVFKVCEDYDDYVKICAASDVPEMMTVGSADFKINAGGANSLLLNHAGGNVAVGAVSTSYILGLGTGDTFGIGTTQWNSADEIDGTKIKDADYGDVVIDAAGDWQVSEATALASNPTDCGANQFAQSIVASGNLTCSAIGDADVPNNITIDLATLASTVTNATFTTALTVDTGTVGLTGNVANSSVLTLGAGASSISGANTGDQDLSGYMQDTDIDTFAELQSWAVGYTDNDTTYPYAINSVGVGGQVWKSDGVGIGDWGTDNNTTYTSSDFTHDDLTGFVANEHLDWTGDLGAVNIHAGNYTDTNTTYVSSDFTHDDLTGFVANEHLDWTADLGAVNINAANYTDTNTTYTAGTGLTLTTGAFSVNTSQNIATLSNLTTNGFITTSGGTGLLGIDTNTYLTGNQTITLSGDVSGSGTTALTVTVGADKILETHLKSVNAPTDEYCLTYESTTGDFEWQECAGGAGDITDVFDCTTGDCNTMTVGTSEYLTYGTGYIDANRFLGVTTIDGTEFGYLDGVSSAIQTQFGGKQSTLTNSAGLLAALNDETGTGLSVFSTSPTFTTPLLGTPTSGVLTNCTGLPEAGLVDNAVTLAKMAHGTDGNLITYDVDGAPAAVATGDVDQVLTSNGVGAAPTFQAAAGGAGDVGGLYGINVETLSADKTLTVDSNKIYQYLDEGGANRIITLDTASASAGDRFVIRHNGDWLDSHYLQIKQSTIELDKIYIGAIKEFIFDGTNWISGENGTAENDNKKYGVAIGYSAYSSNSGVAVGYGSTANSNGTAIGRSSIGSSNGTAIGRSSIGSSNGVAIGYSANTQSKNYSVALGYYSKNYRTSEIAHCIDGSSTQDYNFSIAGWAIQTANATPVEMFLGETANQRFTINPESVVSFTIRIGARDNVANEVASYKIEGLIKRDGAGNTVLSWSSKTVEYEDDASWDVAVTADDTNEALIITVTGDATNPVRFAGRIDEVETQF